MSGRDGIVVTTLCCSSGRGIGRPTLSDDKRGLTPRLWTHAAPDGKVRLNMIRRLDIRDAYPATCWLMTRS